MHVTAIDGDRIETIRDAPELQAWNGAAGPRATYVLSVGDTSMPLKGIGGPVDAEELLEALVHAAPPGPAGVGSSLRERYTSGDCELLATALERVLPDGWIYAVCDPIEDGDGPDMLIHAGLCLPGGLIVDVEGVHQLADWMARWGESALSDEWEHRDVSAAELAEMQADDRIDEAGVADAMPLARLIAGLANLLPEPEPEASASPSP